MMDKKNIEDLYPLSPMQTGMLFHSITAGESGVYIEQLSFAISGSFVPAAFQEAWQRLVNRHSILRTAFLYQDLKEPVQVVQRKVSVPFATLDWRRMEAEEQTDRLNQWMEADRLRGFDLTCAPLMRFTFIQLGEALTQFVWTYHHILLDGWSQPIVFQEVMAQYAALVRGREPALPVSRPFRDYIVWLRRQDRRAAEAFWRQSLEGFFAPTPLFTSKAREAVAALPERYSECEHWLDEPATERIRRFTRQNGLTVNTLVNAAWALLLSRYSREEDVLFGVTVSGRPAELPGADEMVGLFINTLPQRVKISGAQRTLDWLKDLQAYQAALRQFEYSPLVEVQGWSQVPRRMPLFETILIFENYPTRENLAGTALGEDGPGFEIRQIQSVEQTNYPLIFVAGAAEQMMLKLEFDARLFEVSAIQAMLRHLSTLLVNLAEYPEMAVGDLPMLSADERRKVLVEWNQTGGAYPDDVCVHQLFERWAHHSPDAIVLEVGEQRISYAEANRQANQLAWRLRRDGVGPETLVGVCFDRSIPMFLSMLAIFKAGGAYLPLDPHLPPERLAFMLQDAQVKCVLASSTHASQIDFGTCPVLVPDWMEAALAQEPVDNPPLNVRPNHLAYVIYTSGSTGRPKGVLVEHRGVCNLVHYNHRCLEMGSNSRTMQYFSFIFDGSVGEIFSALTSGGTLVLPPPGILPGPELVNWMEAKAITHAFLTPAMMPLMPYANLPALRSIQTGGEVLTIEAARKWAQGRLFTNGYGPTEATVASTVHFICEEDFDNGSIPIGRPLTNVKVYLLDARLHPVPVGVVGELYTGGVHLARGYLNRPELTAERFIPNPFCAQDPTAPPRIYRTGDLARYRADGVIEYVGRIDHQIKIRGFRIELGEIESVLHEQPGISQAAVVVQPAANGDRRLAAFFTVKEDCLSEYQILDLREALRAKLPVYMIPTTFVRLDQMPMTMNGKVDQKALLAQSAGEDGAAARPHISPRDLVEAQLVEIWEDILAVEGVGVQDDFFELGGHSLSAVRLLGQVEQRFGQRLDIASLYLHPTIEQMAGLLREETHMEADALKRLIVPMQTRGDCRPIFFIHPSGGTVHFYSDLARAMGHDRPFYGIESQGLNQELPLQTRVEDMARLYIQAIRSVQPEGPYHLASWSMGVVIAYEMACQLRENGQEVAFLALLDQGPMLPAGEPVDDAAYLVSVFGKHLPLVEEELRSMPAEEQIRFVWNVARKKHFVFPNVSLEQFGFFIRILRTQTEAWRHYHPRPYLGKVTFFRAEQQAAEAPLERDQGWAALAAEVQVVDVPGDHLTMMCLPHVKPLAQKLRTCLEGADEMDAAATKMERA